MSERIDHLTLGKKLSVADAIAEISAATGLDDQGVENLLPGITDSEGPVVIADTQGDGTAISPEGQQWVEVYFCVGLEPKTNLLDLGPKGPTAITRMAHPDRTLSNVAGLRNFR